MQPIELLCEIAAQNCGVAFSAYSHDPNFAVVQSQGFVERAGAVQSIPCLECDEPHDAEIVHHGGRDGFFCPDVGFVPITTGAVDAVQANLPKIVVALADAFECRTRKSSPIAGSTWRVGRVSGEAADILIYFQPSMRTESDAMDLSAALATESGARYRLILSAAGRLQIAGAKTVSLSDAVELDLTRPAFRSVADLRDLVGAPRKNPGGAPNRYAKPLTELIRRRISSGEALSGRNAEASAVLSDFVVSNPNSKPPSLSSVQDYVTKVRAGQ